jgi:hypothetical protein
LRVEGKRKGRGKQKNTANMVYSLSDFTQHWDHEASKARIGPVLRNIITT